MYKIAFLNIVLIVKPDQVCSEPSFTMAVPDLEVKRKVVRILLSRCLCGHPTVHAAAFCKNRYWLFTSLDGDFLDLFLLHPIPPEPFPVAHTYFFT